MYFSDKFIFASPEYTTYEKFVASPYFRKTVCFDKAPLRCEITVSGLGFYRLWVNGTEITKGLLAPYISNPDDIVYFDLYDICPYLQDGENAVCFQLGNGMQNAPGGLIWDFDKARFRGAPRLSFCIEGEADGNSFVIEADESVKTAPSPLYFDDLRSGVRYNAQNEIPGWNLPGFEDNLWQNSMRCETPRGEFRLCCAEPVLPTGEEIKPVSVRPGEMAPFTPRQDVTEFKLQEPPEETKGYLFDFGVNKAGIIRLKINGKKGQRIEIQFAEHLDGDGRAFYSNIAFYPDGYAQRDVYICRGTDEVFEPPFTYHGFRYCLVTGLEENQITENTLTFIVCSSALEQCGGFNCSDETANKLNGLCINSVSSNFYYFPTDCPHREKNGWTGDAAISAEYILLNFKAEKSFAEWLRNIRASMAQNGMLPGIIPTSGWGFRWGNGPAWDAVLTYLPYYTYKYTGNTEILKENATAIFRYLNYIASRRTPRGTVDYGLGDWCPVGGTVKPSREFTDSVTVMSICKKAAFIFDTLNMPLEKQYACALYAEMRDCVRKYLVDFSRMTADTVCQTSQAYAIFHDVFTEAEKPAAFDVLKKLIHSADDHFDVGLLGQRVLFHVLSAFGESELAYKMICRSDYPSYGHFLELGLTALPEDFLSDTKKINSLNHHFMGDISNWFMTSVAGLRFNPHCNNIKEFVISPAFIEALRYASAYYDSPCGKISVEWKREGEALTVECTVPDGMLCTLKLAPEYIIKDAGVSVKQYSSSFRVNVINR